MATNHPLGVRISHGVLNFEIGLQMKIFNKIKKLHEFNAENCRRKQNSAIHDNYIRKIDDITARIKFVVESSNDEHTVIYNIKPYERDMYDDIANYFYNRGFKVTITKIDGFENEFLIINW